MKILVLEPYYGGSHKTFLDGLLAHVPLDFFLLTLPARSWKCRMRLAAPFFAGRIAELLSKEKFDAVLCSSFVDVATLRALLPRAVNRLPFFTYFHENQFVYPVRREDERDFHFGLTNLTSVLASDKVAFNSRYNMETFFTGVERIVKVCPDMQFKNIVETIRLKSSVHYPGIDFRNIDAVTRAERKKNDSPVIIWNHRWEHDKNPKLFFETLIRLDRQDIDFQLILLGQSFRTIPPVFAEALEKLKHRIIHCGFVKTGEEYARLLHSGDVVVSTSSHEFYGISVIEAVRAGCYPLLPARLSYTELFPAEFLYNDDEYVSRLQLILQKRCGLDSVRAKSLTERYSWEHLKQRYLDWFCTVSNC